MRKCSLDKINSVFEEIAKTAKLYLPTNDNDGSAVYKQWEEGVLWSDALNTVRSPKDFFFPQMENLMEFKTEGKNIEVIDTRNETEDFVIFGVRACDVKSFEILDRVFLTEPVDSYYASRREKGIIVSTACTKPAETCFCKTFGISPEDPEGDITTWKTESEIFFKANTEKGAKLLESLDHTNMRLCSRIIGNISGVGYNVFHSKLCFDLRIDLYSFIRFEHIFRNGRRCV